MGKDHDVHKESKKKPQKTLKERRLEKRNKQMGISSPGISGI